jgi:hypothetical protein
MRQEKILDVPVIRRDGAAGKADLDDLDDLDG